MHAFTGKANTERGWRRSKPCRTLVLGIFSFVMIGAVLSTPAFASSSAPAVKMNPCTTERPSARCPTPAVPLPCTDVTNGRPRCKAGYTHRLAGPNDDVCVLPDWHRIAQIDNANAASNVDPTGAYGPNSCKPDNVWREAFPGDLVCVSPEVRMMTREQNDNAANTRACK